MNISADEFVNQFEERFGFAEFDDGALLLDLQTGDFYRLDLSAARICSALKRGQVTSTSAIECIARQLVSRHGRSPALRFQRDGDAYRMYWKGTEVLRVHIPTLELSTVNTQLPSDFPPETCLLSATIHFVLPRDGFVLHAAAIDWEDRVWAFLGRSGAGKTTTANAFVQEGCKAVANDVLVVKCCASGELLALVDAETRLQEWASERAGMFQKHPATISTDELTLPDGPLLPIDRLLFLDAQWRGADSLYIAPLEKPDALGRLLDGGFGAIEQREDWLNLLSVGQCLVDRVLAYRAGVPSNVDQLGETVRDYISKIKS